MTLPDAPAEPNVSVTNLSVPNASVPNASVPNASVPPEDTDRDRAVRRRPERSARTARAHEGQLGAHHLGMGMGVSSGVLTLSLLWLFVIQSGRGAPPALGLTAWCVLGTLTLTTVFVLRRRSPSPPLWLVVLVSVGLVAVVALDLAGSWGQSEFGLYPTAAPAVGALLMSLATIPQTRGLVILVILLGVSLVSAVLLEPRLDPLTFAPEFLRITLGVLPPLFGVAIAQSFRQLVERELDLVLVKSTASQPRFAVGMLASERLARIDLNAERLLNDVAEGREPLPLGARQSARAASVATELRRQLIEGRTETWLHHAVSESEFLGPSVTIVDPAGLGGLLTPLQRDALLRTLWLLITDFPRPQASLVITLGPIQPVYGVKDRQKPRFPIQIATTGVPRRRVEPETWEAIRVVGPHTDSMVNGSLRVEIECSIENPVDA
jgi:hypothetical protein